MVEEHRAGTLQDLRYIGIGARQTAKGRQQKMLTFAICLG